MKLLYSLETFLPTLIVPLAEEKLFLLGHYFSNLSTKEDSLAFWICSIPDKIGFRFSGGERTLCFPVLKSGIFKVELFALLIMILVLSKFLRKFLRVMIFRIAEVSFRPLVFENLLIMNLSFRFPWALGTIMSLLSRSYIFIIII